MNDYRQGYENYKKACEKHGMEPINFHYFILKLSQEQLDAFNQLKEQKRGLDEYAN